MNSLLARRAAGCPPCVCCSRLGKGFALLGERPSSLTAGQGQRQHLHRGARFTPEGFGGTTQFDTASKDGTEQGMCKRSFLCICIPKNQQ